MRLFVFAAVLASVACSSIDEDPMGPTPLAPHIRVLMVTATAGFRHDSIGTARQAVSSLETAGEFMVTPLEQVSLITRELLANYDVLFFALTSGELAFNTAQKAAILDYVMSGGGFIGVHSAADTLYDWPDYERLVGAYFQEHPWTQEGRVVVEDQSHPAAAGLGDRFSILEEFYTFRDNPRTRVQVLLSLDAGSVGSSGDYPLAWAQSFGRGRTYYNALGHFSSTWNDPRFQRQLIGAIRWVARWT
jgi:type 1 glutamine amidotransferase